MYNIYIFIYIYLSIYYSNLQYIFTFVGTYFEQGVGVSTSLNFTIVDVYIHTWWRKGDFEFGRRGGEGSVNLFTIHSNLQYIFTFVGTYFEQGVGVSTSLNFTIVDVYIHTWWRKGDFEFGRRGRGGVGQLIYQFVVSVEEILL